MGDNEYDYNLHELRQIVELIVNQSSSVSESDAIEPDLTTVKKAMEQIRNGECLTTEEYLHDIQSRLLRSSKTE